VTDNLDFHPPLDTRSLRKDKRGGNRLDVAHAPVHGAYFHDEPPLPSYTPLTAMIVPETVSSRKTRGVGVGFGAHPAAFL